jgi:thiol-disulfide isomerase/thioredoxin
MRSLRTTLAVASLLGIAPAVAGAQNMPPVKDLLGLSPILKKGVEYEVPTDPAALKACKVETVTNAQKRAIGYALVDGQGKLLRRFVDSDGSGSMNQWSFYQDGFEVYRESDKNHDKSPEECRWLNGAGTRVGVMAGGKISGWKRLSAEEASKVLVQALVSGDVGLLETVLATPDELAKLGVPKGEIDQVAAASAQRVEQIRNLHKGLTGWNSQFVWNRLDGMMPHLIPADPETGLTQDLVLYENAVIFAGPANGQVDPAKIAFLQVPEMVKIGDVWKFVELPRAIPPDKPIVASADGGIRSWLFRSQPGGVGPQNPELDSALKDLARYDEENARILAGVDKKAIAQYHISRVPLLNAVVKSAKPGDEPMAYKKQIIDSLVAAVQTGLYPNGIKIIDRLVADDQGQGGKLDSYAAFRKVAADFALKNGDPDANLIVNQKRWMTDLKGFLDKYPKSDEAPDAFLQLASAFEFNAEEDEARKYYSQLAQDFPASEAGKKAAGALRRLDLVGKSIVLKGTGLRNEEVDSTQYQGKILLVTFWATWAEPVKRDLPELAKIYQKYHGNGFEIVGVSLDSEKSDLDAFLKETPIAWPQIFEPGGMDSRLATEFGIISLPTMILVDAQGKVLNRNIRTASELDRQLEKVAAGKTPGVALEAK